MNKLRRKFNERKQNKMNKLYAKDTADNKSWERERKTYAHTHNRLINKYIDGSIKKNNNNSNNEKKNTA